MNHRFFSCFVLVLFISIQLHAQKPGVGQYPPFTKWYQNPLGLSPLSLHTANGLYLPALATVAILIFSDKDSSALRTCSVYADTGVSFGYYASKTTVYQQDVGVLFPVRWFLSLGAEISTVHVVDNVNDAWGTGIRPFARFYLMQSETVKLYFQSGAGLIRFGDNFPQPSGFFGDNREGTRWNGSPKYGIGTQLRLGKRLSCDVAAWHIHFSNGDHPNDSRNPGHDSNGFTVGISYRPVF